MPDTITKVNIPKPLVRQAFKQAAASARRQANAQKNKYGADHPLVQMLDNEAQIYEAATID